MIRQFLESGRQDGRYKARNGGIVPHAGWVYSGEIACRVLHCLQGGEPPDIVVIFGMHLHRGDTGYMMPEGAWETPFGEIPVDTELARALADRFSFQIETTERFVQDNTIELQLPFLKYFFPETRIVAAGVPPSEMALDVGDYIVEHSLQRGVSIKVIGSTDLTHYGPNYGFSPKGEGVQAVEWVRDENDRTVIDRMLAMDASGVLLDARNKGNACCAGAAAAALSAGRKLGAEKAFEVDYATSYDRSPGDSFVGYTGIVF